MKILSWNCFLLPWSPTRKIKLMLICGQVFDLKTEVVCLRGIYLKRDAVFLASYLEQFYPYSYRNKNLLLLSKESKGIDIYLKNFGTKKIVMQDMLNTKIQLVPNPKEKISKHQAFILEID